MKKIWFKRKTYGYGWTPSTWEGWVTILVWAVLFTFLMTKITEDDMSNLYLVFISVAILIAICLWKGEKPRFQWGEKDQDK